MPQKSKKRIENNQIEQFKNQARALECDESEERFDEALGKIAKAKPRAPDVK